MKLISKTKSEIFEVKYLEGDKVVATTYHKFKHYNGERNPPIEFTSPGEKVQINQYRLEELNYIIQRDRGFTETLGVGIKNDKELVRITHTYQKYGKEKTDEYTFKNNILQGEKNNKDEDIIPYFKSITISRPHALLSFNECLSQLEKKTLQNTHRLHRIAS